MQQAGHHDGGTSGFVAMRMPLAPEEQARADMYGLLAVLLLTPPSVALLDQLAATASLSTPPDTTAPASNQPLDLAWESLSLTARLLPPGDVIEEFNELFIGTGAPRLSPHASIYLAGFLHEKPLAELRAELARLGLGRRAGARETEDHLGALCETMRQLIVRRHPLATQQAFFAAYLASWTGTCLQQLRRAEGAQFYARVAELAEAFFSIEQQAFALAADPAPL
jgi:TorA maturation chaperone TorD